MSQVPDAQGVELVKAKSPWAAVRKWISLECATAFVIFVLSIFLLAQSITLGLERQGAVGAGFFPAIVATAMVVLSGVWVVSLLFNRTPAEGLESPIEDAVSEALDVEDPRDSVNLAKRAVADEASEGENDSEAGEGAEGSTYETESRLELRRIVILIAASAVALPLVYVIGMALMLFVYVSLLLIFLARVKIWKSVVFTFLACVFIAWGAFRIGIYFPDPLGIQETFVRLGI